MAGTITGGKKAAAKNIANNPNFYSDIGKKGVAAYNAKAPHERKPRGFAYNPELARKVGAIGGAKSRRKKAQ